MISSTVRNLIRNMESSRLWTRALVCAVLLSIVLSAEIDYSDSELDLDTRSVRDFYPKDPNLTNEKQLLGALHDVLKKLQTKRLPFWEKKFGQVPTVNVTISTNLLNMERPIFRKTDCLNWRVKLHFNILTFTKCVHVPCFVVDVI
uniref:Cocaine- and amphetamine-regulated transcript protein n=1 Tax=Oncorhynchus kisutch TaxID=8019 RepID=A0A8C7K9S1_ONCKI